MKKIISTLILSSLLIACDNSQNTNNTSSTNDNASKRVLNFGSHGSPAPYSFYKDDKLTGLDVEIVKAIAKELNYELNTQVLEFPSILASVENARLDLAANGIAKNAQREEKFTFSKPLYHNSNLILVPATSEINSFEDVFGKNTVGEPGINYTIFWEGHNETKPEQKVNLSYTEADLVSQVRDVINGKFDFKLESALILQHIVKSQQLEEQVKLIAIDDAIFGANKRFAYAIFAKNAEGAALKEEFDTALIKLVESGKISELTQEFVGGDYAPTLEDLQ